MDDLFQIFTNTADGAFVIDKNQHIVYWNQTAEDLLGYAAEEVIGQSCYKILQGCKGGGQTVCRHRCPVSTAAFSGQCVTNYDVAAHTKSDELRWINISILRIDSRTDEAAPYLVHLFRDATQAKQNEQFIHHMFRVVDRQQDLTEPVINPVSAEARMARLTGCEAQVLSLMANGSSTTDMARSLSISSSTVRNHIQNILHKLRVHSRLEAVAYALNYDLEVKA